MQLPCAGGTGGAHPPCSCPARAAAWGCRAPCTPGQEHPEGTRPLGTPKSCDRIEEVRRAWLWCAETIVQGSFVSPYQSHESVHRSCGKPHVQGVWGRLATQR